MIDSITFPLHHRCSTGDTTRSSGTPWLDSLWALLRSTRTPSGSWGGISYTPQHSMGNYPSLPCAHPNTSFQSSSHTPLSPLSNTPSSQLISIYYKMIPTHLKHVNIRSKYGDRPPFARPHSGPARFSGVLRGEGDRQGVLWAGLQYLHPSGAKGN